MNDSFTFISVGTLKCLVHTNLHEAGISHGFVTNCLNLKDFDCSKHLSLPEIGNISLAKQTHSTNVLTANEFGQEGDAFVLKTGERCGVRTADCVPLILVSEKGDLGAVVHAGWQGACAGVVEQTITELVRSGRNLENFIALIGPSALDCCYEVKSDVSSKFNSGLSIRRASTYLSVPEYVKNILIRGGVKNTNIHMSGICTICSNSFFSFRRDGDLAGRFLSFLSIT